MCLRFLKAKRIAALLRAIGFFATKCATGAAGFRPAWQIAQGQVVRDQPRQEELGIPAERMKSAGTAYRTAVSPSRRKLD
jgi:hypothetical protein